MHGKRVICTNRYEEETLLEVEKQEKEFKFVLATLEQQWEKPWNEKGVTSYPVYELHWKNRGSKKWGRTELWKKDGKPMDYKQAVKEFFFALRASEHMQFREL